MDVLPLFSNKRLRKNRNNNQPSTINLRGKQKTTTIKDSRHARMPAKEKNKTTTINLSTIDAPLDACQRRYVSTCEVAAFVFDKKRLRKHKKVDVQ